MALKYQIESVGTVSIATSWFDVKFSQFVEFLNLLQIKKPDDHPLEFISVRTGLAVDVLERIPLQYLSDFDRLTSFFFDADSLKAFNIVDDKLLIPIEEKKGLKKKIRLMFRMATKKELPKVNIPVMSWEQLEKSKQAIKSAADQKKHHMSASDEIFFIYCGERLNHMKVPAAYGLASFFLKVSMHLKTSSSD